MYIPQSGGDKKNHPCQWLHQIYLPLRAGVTSANVLAVLGSLFALFMLLVLPAPWNIRLPLYLVALVWTILRPRTALYLMPFAVPWGSLDSIDLAGLHLNSADVLVAFLALGWLMGYALNKHIGISSRNSSLAKHSSYAGPLDRENHTIPRYLTFAILGLLATMALSTVSAININSSLKELSKWLEFLTIMLLGAQYIRTRRQLWTIVVLILLAGLSQALYGYFQEFYNLGPSVFVRSDILRVYGTFDQPNPFAGYLNMALSIAVALLLLGRNLATRVLAGIVVVIIGGAEYLTGSRGGQIAIVAALAFIIVVGMPKLHPLIRLLVIGGLGIIELYLAGLLPSSVLSPVLRVLGLSSISFTSPSPQDFPTAERLAHWIAGVNMFITHPFTGVGIGNYPDAYPNYYITIFINPLGHAHNYYINIAAETGSIGFTAYLLFLLAIFVALISAYQHVNQKYLRAKSLSKKPYILKETRKKPVGLQAKLRLLMNPFRLVEYYQQPGINGILGILTNDRSLAIGLFAAFLTVCIHNLVDDLYVHSMTNLIALLLIALIRLEEVTPIPGETI